MCKVLQIPRSTYYYEAKERTKEDDITADVIDVFQAGRWWVVSALPRLVTRQEHAAVILTLHEDVYGLAVGVDPAPHHLAVLILLNHRFHEASRTTLGGLIVSLARIIHP